jgi:tyrosyl-tRNA synthetase
MTYKKSRKLGGVKIHPSDKKSKYKTTNSYKKTRKEKVGKYIKHRKSTPTSHILRMIHENYNGPEPALLEPEEFVEHVRQMYLLNGQTPIPLTYEETSELYRLQTETNRLLNQDYVLTDEELAEFETFE